MDEQYRYHFPVLNLKDVARPFMFGRAVFRPLGWLMNEIEAPAPDADEVLRQLRQVFQDGARDLDCATADALADTRDEAKILVSDAVAALRLFQRRSHRFLSLDRQTFGLVGEVGSTVERHWRTTAEGGFAAGGYKVSGVIGDWVFTAEQLDAVAADPVMTFLDRCLQRAERDLEQFDARILTALRLLNSATIMATPGVRIVLIASAVEALLGDDPMQERVHRIALRAALLTCNRDDAVHHGAAWPCAYFAQPTGKDLRKFMEAERKQKRHGVCSAYWKHRDIFDARNAVLHDAKLEFDHRLAEKFEGRVDTLIANVILWHVETRGALPELDAGVRAAAPAS